MKNELLYKKKKRGFGGMTKAKQRKIASMGGKAQGKHNNSGNFANNRDRASECGQRGGRGQGWQSNPGNFYNNPENARRAGTLGGLSPRRV